DTEHGMGVDTSIFTRFGTKRIAHYAFQLARKRNKKVTTVTKSNTLINSLTYWDRVVGEVAKEYPDVEHRYMYIDATSANFVLRPWIFDVVLTTNLFGDINPEKDYPSMFEPIHGSAPDIAGQNIANPFGMFWSVSLMLEHLGEIEAANLIMKAADSVLSEGNLPVDLGGNKKTFELAELVASKI
ncbi:MAG: isocitrate/isopropylmalate family dehydrogenase, partial [Bacteroidales bacterium]